MKTLIKNVGIYKDHVITEHQNIAIEDTRISGFPDSIHADEYDTIIEGKGMLATPGFVNTHNHIAMCRLANINR